MHDYEELGRSRPRPIRLSCGHAHALFAATARGLSPEASAGERARPTETASHGGEAVHLSFHEGPTPRRPCGLSRGGGTRPRAAVARHRPQRRRRDCEVSPRRAAFFCAAVAALDAELRERGSQLVVRRGKPEKRDRRDRPRGRRRRRRVERVVRCRRNAAATVELQSRTRRTRACARWSCTMRRQSRRRRARRHAAPPAPAIAPSRRTSMSGGSFRSRRTSIRCFCASPRRTIRRANRCRSPTSSAATREARPPVRPSRGVASNASCARRAAQYAPAANVPSEDRTSHLSAHLSFGTISARAVARAVRERLSDPFALSEERLSLRLFLRALAHRDFFLAAFVVSSVDARRAAAGEDARLSHGNGRIRALDVGARVSTGYPLVDAGIRQLHATGWMHPHVRAVAASFLCFDLGVDWRVGRDEWDRWLIEDDPALATGNWQWIAGVGADMAQYPRIYNPERQRRRYDPAGAVRAALDTRTAAGAARSVVRTGAPIRRNSRSRSLPPMRIRSRPSITALRRVRFCAAIASLQYRSRGSVGNAVVDPAALTTGTRTSSPFQVLMP